jgi:UDP-N-acetylglucosamine acyltransferase
MDLNNWTRDDRGNKIHMTAIIGSNVELGKNNVIYPYAVIGMSGFIRNLDEANGKIIIGDNNRIGNHVSIMVGESGLTSIGDNNFIMNYCNIAHDVKIGSNNEIGAKTILAGYSKISNNNSIKISCVIRNRKIIGSDNIIGMGSNVTKDFDINGWLIYGSPARQIRLR